MTTSSHQVRKALSSIVIAGGGTGGHVYPGVAIADEVKRRNPDAKVAFIGTTRGLESKIVPKSGYELATINVSRLKGGGVMTKLKGLFRLPVAMFQSWRILRRIRPDVVIGVGGYASGPALLAGVFTFRKTAIQEQNATPGLTNRWLGKLVKRVFLGFGAGVKAFSSKKTVYTGNPIRHAIAERLRASSPSDAKALRVLVFGGSQGATFLNERVPALLAKLSAALDSRLVITHQTGTADLEATTARYIALSLESEVLPFIDDMPKAYGTADLAICRAGALTIAELTAVGLPSLLVPFPFAADNHQEANARVLEAHGAALVATQKDWDEALLLDHLKALATDRNRLAEMARKSRELAKLDAVTRIVDALEELAA
jgi:UDP-N-acetylglucosamine--N-acetylmuramyl-(pentapeptide) pyrophosphoryl-undecaprenol N-acetylglucosamine transferase